MGIMHGGERVLAPAIEQDYGVCMMAVVVCMEGVVSAGEKVLVSARWHSWMADLMALAVGGHIEDDMADRCGIMGQ